jgi:alpha-ketoglutarate-dependent taurine dioxygenase
VTPPTPTLTIEPLAETVGAEVRGVDADRLAGDDALATAVLAALEANGVLVFRGLHLAPETQVAFCRRLGEVDESASNHPVAGIYLVSLDKAKNRSADYLHGTFHWHIDGCTPEGDECPQMATVLTAKAVAEAGDGGETEFASTYAAYDELAGDEKARLAALRVRHTLEASQRKVHPDPTGEQLAGWRRRKTSVHPLVWTHRDGRRSLVLGASADHVIDLDEGRALLDDLLARATRPERVYRHSWSVGDTVIWDNRGVLHRAVPYDPTSPREMLRTTVLGDEPIQ